MDRQGADRRRVREVEVLLNLVTDQAEKSLIEDTGPPGSHESEPPSSPAYPSRADTGLKGDLRAPIHLDARSPFSIFNLLDASGDGLSGLEGRSLEQAVLDPATPVKALEFLKNLGKLLILPGASERMALLGRALYFLSAAAARVHAGAEIGSMDRQSFREGIEALVKTDGLSLPLVDLCRKACSLEKAP